MGFVGRLCTSRSGPVVWPDCRLYVENIPPSSVVEGSLAGRGESVTQSPPAKIGIRSHRELVTLALVVDEEGRSLQALDILLQSRQGELPRRRLERGKAHGVDPGLFRQHGARGGEGPSRKRVAGAQAQGGDVEGSQSQMGSRQRARSVGGKAKSPEMIRGQGRSALRLLRGLRGDGRGDRRGD